MFPDEAEDDPATALRSAALVMLNRSASSRRAGPIAAEVQDHDGIESVDCVDGTPAGQVARVQWITGVVAEHAFDAAEDFDVSTEAAGPGVWVPVLCSGLS